METETERGYEDTFQITGHKGLTVTVRGKVRQEVDGGDEANA